MYIFSGITWISVAVAAATATVVFAEDQYSVPAPNIEAFSPKGLRLSIPDSRDIKSVQFYLRFDYPVFENDPGRVDKVSSSWTYTNPSVTLKPGDFVHYKVIVNHGGQFCTREGSSPISAVMPCWTDSTFKASVHNCDDQGQHLIPLVPNLNQVEENGQTSSTGSRQVKSAYTMYKTMGTKPIARSSTTTTSGTFYVKPTGDVEASGFKTSSNYDSSRRDGEQWQHSKSELTVAEIEELKRIHGQDFLSMPAFAHLHGSTGSSSSSYRSSYSSSQTRPVYGSSSSYIQTEQISQPLKPAVGSYSSISKYEQSEGSKGAPAISPPAETSFSSSDSSYIHNPVSHFDHSYANQEDAKKHIAPSFPSYSSIQSTYQKKETVKTSVPVVDSYPSADSSATKLTETYEYRSPPKVVVPGSLYNSPTLVTTVPPPLFRTINNEIFVSAIRPTSPQSCAATDYRVKAAGEVDLVKVEQSVQRLGCLAELLETVVKNEMKALKSAEAKLTLRLQDLEEDMRKLRSNCQCAS